MCNDMAARETTDNQTWVFSCHGITPEACCVTMQTIDEKENVHVHVSSHNNIGEQYCMTIQIYK